MVLIFWKDENTNANYDFTIESNNIIANIHPLGCGKEEERGLGTSTVPTIEFDGEVGTEVGVVGGEGWMGVDRIGEVGLEVFELVLTAPPPLR